MSRLTAVGTVWILLACVIGQAQAPHVVTSESTVTATVDHIEKGPRTVTLRGDGNQYQTVYVDPSVKEFDDLKTGDVVTVRYVESVIMQVKPNAALSQPRDTTEDARKAGQAQVVSQQKAVVTIENIDSQGLFVTYRTGGGMRAVRGVNDKRLLEGLRVGDRIEITLTRERAVSIQPRR
jgi:hypothetical protein